MQKFLIFLQWNIPSLPRIVRIRRRTDEIFRNNQRLYVEGWWRLCRVGRRPHEWNRVPIFYITTPLWIPSIQGKRRTQLIPDLSDESICNYRIVWNSGGRRERTQVTVELQNIPAASSGAPPPWEYKDPICICGGFQNCIVALSDAVHALLIYLFS